MTKSRAFLFLLLAFVAGIALRSFLLVPIAVVWILIVFGAVLAVLASLYPPRSRIIYGFLLIAFAFGIFRFEQADISLPDPARFYGEQVLIRGYVLDEPERAKVVERLKFKVEEVDGLKISEPFYTLVTLGRYPRHYIGDELLLRGSLEEPENFSDFDYISYLEKDGIKSVMSFPEAEKIGDNRGSRLKLVLSKIKNSFEKNLDAALPEPHAAFIKGLTLGERESLPEDLVEDFKRTGTTHIVALSGYNITLIGGFIENSLLMLTVPFRVSFWIATFVIFLFVILTGASPSVVRAGIMGILVLIARREGRLYHMTNALAFAGAVMIFQNPKILRFDAAFQLSFLATLGLVYLSPRVESFMQKLRPRPNLSRINQDPDFSGVSLPKKETPGRLKLFPLKQIFIETLAAQIMVLPLLIYLFGRVSLISPLTNLLILIAVPYSMALGFLTGFLGFLWGPLANIVGAVNWVLLEYKIRVIEFFAKFPAASMELGFWILIPMLVIYGLLFIYLLKSCVKMTDFSLAESGQFSRTTLEDCPDYTSGFNFLIRSSA